MLKKTDIQTLIDFACARSRIKEYEFYSEKRLKSFVAARQRVMFILYEKFGYSTKRIAKIVNRKDHTTVLHGIQRVRIDRKKLKDAELLYDKFTKSIGVRIA